MDWIILPASLFNLFLGIFVWARNPRNSINVYFGIFGVVTAIYIAFDFIFRLHPNLIILQTTYGLAALVPATACLWVFKISRIKLERPIFTNLLLQLPAVILFALVHINGLLIKSVDSLTVLGYRGTLGPLFVPYAAYFLVYIAFLICVLYIGQRRAREARKFQLRLILFGISLYSLSAVFLSLILPTFFDIYGFTMLDAPSSILFVGFTAYAITRYRFLDVRLVLIRSITFGLIILLTSAILTFITALLTRLAGIDSIIFSSAIIAVLLAMGYPPLKYGIERVTNRILYKRSYNPDELLANITAATSSLLNLKELLSKIAQELGSAFHSDKIGFALINKSGGLEAAFRQNFSEAEADKILQYPGTAAVMTRQFEALGAIIAIDELKIRFDNGEYAPAAPELLNLLYASDVALLVALKDKDKLLGVIALGNKKSGDLYTLRDMAVLKIIAGHISVAVSNALLYEETLQFNVKLKDEIAKATADLEKANAHLRELDQSKSEFLSIAAHQLRTPLTGIKGYVSMFLEGDFGGLTPPQRTELDKIYRASDRLTRLIEVFLNVSRIETGRMELAKAPIRFEQIVDDVVHDLTAAYKQKGLTLTVQPPSQPLPPMLLDRDKIQDVVMNLVDNAIKYTPKGNINVRLDRSPSLLSFQIKDSGIGIEQSDIDKLFQKFSRADVAGHIQTGGSGLGLFVAKKIIEAHGGRIWAESEGKGKGSSFTFTLPIVDVDKVDKVE